MDLLRNSKFDCRWIPCSVNSGGNPRVRNGVFRFGIFEFGIAGTCSTTRLFGSKAVKSVFLSGCTFKTEVLKKIPAIKKIAGGLE
jgi:hypothetical protein